MSRNRENRVKTVKIPRNGSRNGSETAQSGEDQYGRNITHGVNVFEHHGGWHPWRTLGSTNIGLLVQGCRGAWKWV